MTIFLTVIGTVLSGIIVFIFSEILKEIWLAPLQEYKKIKSKVSFALTMYGEFYNNPISSECHSDELNETYNQASIELRKTASELRAFIETLSWFKPLIPKRENLYKASANIIGLSNTLTGPSSNLYEYVEANTNRENEIYDFLKLYKEKA